MTSPRVRVSASNRTPPAAVAADLLAVALVAAGTIAFFSTDTTFRILTIRISMRAAWRPFVWALLVLILRNWFVRRPPSFSWVVAPVKRLMLDRLANDARAPIALDERALFFESSMSRVRRLSGVGWLLIAFSTLMGALLWPQIRQIRSVSDLGDPLFSIWRLAWISHQLPRAPLALFDGNQFHPERLTLTYSDAMLVPGLLTAPLFWLGVHPVVNYNLLLLSTFVLSALTMFLLVRALTGRVDAALIAGTLFALYPYRFEHYSHLELLVTMWMPLALWGLHRTLARARWRDGLMTGAAFGLQTLSSLYYGCFLAVYMTVLGGALWIGQGRPRAPIRPLAAGAILAAVLVAPVAAAYIASRPMMGTRDEGTIQFYSAEGPDYLKPHYRSRVYRQWSDRGHPERQLFPRITPVVLSAVAIWPPLSVARIAYVLGFIVALDGSFGFNGPTFTALHATLSPFKGLRVPARFSLLAGMTLAILAGYGAARLLERWPRRRVALSALLLAAVVGEALPALGLQRVWDEPPPIYASIAGREPPTVLAEFPMPRDIYRSDFDTRYLYFSTFHWQNLVNGNSGFFPPSYFQLLANEQDFPSEKSLAYLRSRGVQYLTMHGTFMTPRRYRDVVAWLDARADLELIAKAPWEGAESRLYRLR
jgi:hypothetical protein